MEENSPAKGYSTSKGSIQEVISSKFAIRMGDVFQILYEMKALIGKMKRRFVYNYRISRLPISKAIGSNKFCSHRAYSFINCCKGQRLI